MAEEFVDTCPGKQSTPEITIDPWAESQGGWIRIKQGVECEPK